LVAIVRSIQSGALSEDEVDEAVARFESAVPHPAPSDLIFWPGNWGLPQDATPEAVVATARGWTPRVVALRVVRSTPTRRGSARCLVELEGGQFKSVSVVSESKVKAGAVVAVALSGVELRDGRRAEHGYVDKAYSMGILLDEVGAEVGSDLTKQYAKIRN